jgi:hypothetical protein
MGKMKTFMVMMRLWTDMPLIAFRKRAIRSAIFSIAFLKTSLEVICGPIGNPRYV